MRHQKAVSELCYCWGSLGEGAQFVFLFFQQAASEHALMWKRCFRVSWVMLGYCDKELLRLIVWSTLDNWNSGQYSQFLQCFKCIALNCSGQRSLVWYISRASWQGSWIAENQWLSLRSGAAFCANVTVHISSIFSTVALCIKCHYLTSELLLLCTNPYWGDRVTMQKKALAWVSSMLIVFCCLVISSLHCILCHTVICNPVQTQDKAVTVVGCAHLVVVQCSGYTLHSV